MNKSTSHPKQQRHHYIPQFYLKKWAGPDGRICEFCRRYKGIVKPRMTHPAGTGYVDNLYTLSGVPPEAAQLLETQFFKVTDQLASDALNILLHGRISEMSADIRSGWSRFVLSLIHRHPEKIAWIKEELQRSFNEHMPEVKKTYDSVRRPSDPETFEEYIAIHGENAQTKAFATLLKGIVDSAKVGDYLNRMRWSVLTVENPAHCLLTSDRPVITSNGLKYPNSYISVSLSPNALFLAVNAPQEEQRIQNIPVTDLIKEVNSTVCKQAQKYVYGTNDRQLRFVANRLGRGTPQFIASRGSSMSG